MDIMKKIFVFWLIFAILCGYIHVEAAAGPACTQGICNMVLSPDGMFIAVSLWNDDIYIINTSTKTRDIISLPPNMRVPVSALAFDEHLAIGYSDGVVRVINRAFEEVVSFKAYDAPISKLSLDGNLLAVFAGSQANIWDITACRCIYSVNVEHVDQVFLLHSLRNLLFVSSENSIIIRDFKEDKIISTLQGSAYPITACVIHNDDLWIASRDGTLKKWSIYSGECAMILKTRYVFSSLSISTDSQSLIGASKAGVGVVWDLATGRVIDCIAPKDSSGGARFRNCFEALATHNAVVFATALCDVAAYKIGSNKHRVTFINELECPIDNIEVYDKRAAELCIFSGSCASCSHSDLDCRIFSACASYKLSLRIGGIIHIADHIHDMRRIQRMIITQSVKNGRLILMLARKSDRVDGTMDMKGYNLIPLDRWVYRQRERLQLLAYTIGEPLVSLTLTDTQGVCAQAQSHMSTVTTQVQDQQYRNLDSVVEFHNILPEGPYALCAETQNMRYQWSIPFLSSRSELLLTVAPCLVHLKLYDELSEQFFSVPLSARKSLIEQRSKTAGLL